MYSPPPRIGWMGGGGKKRMGREGEEGGDGGEEGDGEKGEKGKRREGEGRGGQSMLTHHLQVEFLENTGNP